MQPAIPHDLVRHELRVVCASQPFVRSPRHQKLLQYLVAELLADRLANLREIHLGVHVFGRPAADFDPASDAIVRVEASRLRARLQRYYASEGSEQRIHIELPLGSYIPTLSWRSAQPIHRDEGATLPVVVVLPLAALENAGGAGSSDIDAWSDALTEEITDTLARLPEIRVVARTSAMRFKGVRGDIREIAKSLSANVLIEGSLQREGERLRVIAQIITANDGLHLWSDSVVGDVNKRFHFFDVVCAMIRRAMPLAINALDREAGAASGSPVATTATPLEGEHSSAVQAHIPEAVRDLYDRGRIAIRIRTTASLARATALFTEAVAAAPEFARAQSALAAALFQEVGMTMRAPTEAAAPMRACIEKALSLDPQLPEAHATLGMFLFYYEHDWPAAERSLLRAIRFGPSYVSAHRAYAFALMMMRRFAEADHSFIQARALDPLDALTRVHHALLRFYERRFEEAQRLFEGMLDTDANNVIARTLLAATCLHRGELARAGQLYREAAARHPDLSIGLCGLAVTLAYDGRIDEAKGARDALRAFAEKCFVSWYQLAMVDCALGDDDAAHAALERAASTHDFNFLCSAVDPTFDRLHGSSAWIALMQRYRLPHD